MTLKILPGFIFLNFPWFKRPNENKIIKRSGKRWLNEKKFLPYNPGDLSSTPRARKGGRHELTLTAVCSLALAALARVRPLTELKESKSTTR